MCRQILMIGLPAETNDTFSEAFALDHMPVEVCQDIDESRSLLRKNQYRLILYNAEKLDVDEAQEMASRIRTLDIGADKQIGYFNLPMRKTRRWATARCASA